MIQITDHQFFSKVGSGFPHLHSRGPKRGHSHQYDILSKAWKLKRLVTITLPVWPGDTGLLLIIQNFYDV
jgi:hypothetical protein